MKRFFKLLGYGFGVFIESIGNTLGLVLICVLCYDFYTTDEMLFMFFTSLIVTGVITVSRIYYLGTYVEEYKQLKEVEEKKDGNELT